jgi:hypothetical protein
MNTNHNSHQELHAFIIGTSLSLRVATRKVHAGAGKTVRAPIIGEGSFYG